MDDQLNAEGVDADFAKFQLEWDRRDGRDPSDLILWIGNNGGRLEKSQFRIRVPPRSAVQPCYVKCYFCKVQIDISYDWLSPDVRDILSIFDIDCPHCWKINTISTPTAIQKIQRFRRKCEKWYNPPAQKPGRVSPSLRFSVLERDGFRCTYCGATPQQTSLHIDHKIPVIDGGTNDIENLVTACAECNLGKGNRSLDPG